MCSSDLIEEMLEQAQAVHQARGQFFMTRIVSAAGVFVFVHELIGAIATVVTMNEYERLLIISERLGVDGAKLLELQQNSELSDVFDWSAVAAWCVIFAGALALAWRKYQGVRVAASERPDLNEPSSQPHKLSPRG